MSLKNKIQDKVNVFPDHMELKIFEHLFKDDEIISNHIYSNNKLPIELTTKDDENKIINAKFITNEGRKFDLNFNY